MSRFNKEKSFVAMGLLKEVPGNKELKFWIMDFNNKKDFEKEFLEIKNKLSNCFIIDSFESFQQMHLMRDCCRDMVGQRQNITDTDREWAAYHMLDHQIQIYGGDDRWQNKQF